MSGFIAMVPVIAGWPAFVAAAAVAGGALGLKVLTESEVLAGSEIEQQVEVDMPQSHKLAESIGEGDTLRLQGNGFTVEFHKTGRGDCQMRVCGKNKSDAELETLGKDLLNRIAQQYAYQKITQELKKKGFQVAEEKVEQDRTIRLTVRRTR